MQGLEVITQHPLYDTIKRAAEDVVSGRISTPALISIAPDAPPARIPLRTVPTESLYIGLIDAIRALVAHMLSHKGHVPEASIVVVGVMYVLHTRPKGYIYNKVCLAPKQVIENEQHYRLITSCATHLDASHLACSVATMLPQMLDSEANHGPIAATMDFAIIAGMTSALQVGASWVAKQYLDNSECYSQLGSIGLMPTALGLRMLHTLETPDSLEALLGVFPCPPRLSVWLHLLAAHAAVPCQSFLANMCGLYSGMIYAAGIAPVLRMLGLRKCKRRIASGKCDVPRHWKPSRKPQHKLLFQLGMSGLVLGVRALLARGARR